jgi:hypothetical protein
MNLPRATPSPLRGRRPALPRPARCRPGRTPIGATLAQQCPVGPERGRRGTSSVGVDGQDEPGGIRGGGEDVQVTVGVGCSSGGLIRRPCSGAQWRTSAGVKRPMAPWPAARRVGQGPSQPRSRDGPMISALSCSSPGRLNWPMELLAAGPVRSRRPARRAGLADPRPQPAVRRLRPRRAAGHSPTGQAPHRRALHRPHRGSPAALGQEGGEGPSHGAQGASQVTARSWTRGDLPHASLTTPSGTVNQAT